MVVLKKVYKQANLYGGKKHIWKIKPVNYSTKHTQMDYLSWLTFVKWTCALESLKNIVTVTARQITLGTIATCFDYLAFRMDGIFFQDQKSLQNYVEMSLQPVRTIKLNVIFFKKRPDLYIILYRTYICIFVIPLVQITSVKVPGDKMFGVQSTLS